MNTLLIHHWTALNNALSSNDIGRDLDGKTLDLATVVAGARYVAIFLMLPWSWRDLAAVAALLTGF